MIRLAALLSLLVLVPPPAAAAACTPTQIEIFTVTTLPVASHRRYPATTLARYHLDSQRLLEQRLGEGLVHGRAHSARVLNQRLAQLPRGQLAGALQQTVDGVMGLRRYGLSRVPAIVFDGRAAVLGERDLDRAVSRYRSAGCPGADR